MLSTNVKCDHCGKEVSERASQNDHWLVLNMRWLVKWDTDALRWDYCSLECLVAGFKRKELPK